MFKPKAITVTAQPIQPTINSMAVIPALPMRNVGRVHQGRITHHGNRHFAQTIKHQPVLIQPLQKPVHALLTTQAVRHGKVRLTAPTVNTVSQCLVDGSRLLTPVRLTRHHAEQAQKPKH